MKINLIILTINTYIIYKSGQLIYSANKVISLYKQDYPIVYFVPNRTVIKKKKQTIRRNKEVKSKLIKKGDQECIFQHSQSPILPLFQ